MVSLWTPLAADNLPIGTFSSRTTMTVIAKALAPASATRPIASALPTVRPRTGIGDRRRRDEHLADRGSRRRHADVPALSSPHDGFAHRPGSARSRNQTLSLGRLRGRGVGEGSHPLTSARS